MKPLAAAIELAGAPSEADLLGGRGLEGVGQELWHYEPPAPKQNLSHRAEEAVFMLARTVLPELYDAEANPETDEEQEMANWRHLHRRAEELLEELGGWARAHQDPWQDEARGFLEDGRKFYADLPTAHRLAGMAEKLAGRWLRFGELIEERLQQELGEGPCLVRQQTPRAVVLSVRPWAPGLDEFWGPIWRAARLRFAALPGGGLRIERRALERPRLADPEQILFFKPLEPYLRQCAPSPLTVTSLAIPEAFFVEADPVLLAQAARDALERAGFEALGKSVSAEIGRLNPDAALRLAGRYLRLKGPQAE